MRIPYHNRKVNVRKAPYEWIYICIRLHQFIKVGVHLHVNVGSPLRDSSPSCCGMDFVLVSSLFYRNLSLFIRTREIRGVSSLSSSSSASSVILHLPTLPLQRMNGPLPEAGVLRPLVHLALPKTAKNVEENVPLLRQLRGGDNDFVETVNHFRISGASRKSKPC